MLVEKNGTLSQESQGSTRRSHDSAKILMSVRVSGVTLATRMFVGYIFHELAFRPSGP